MKKTGYVIAKNKSLQEFFIASSAYDRPRWVPLAEATVYPTADIAQTASTKLYKSSGSYEARLASYAELVEAMGRDDAPAFPGEEDQSIGAPVADEVPNDQVTDDDEDKMTAQSQGGDDLDADSEMGMGGDEDLNDEEDQNDIEGMVDRELGNEPEDDGTVGMPGEDDDIEGAPEAGFDETDINFGPDENEENAQLRPEEVRLMNRGLARPGVTESATMPKKPAKDAQPTENKTTADKMAKTPEIDYKQPSNKFSKPDTDLTKSGAEPHEDKVKVPANIKADLKAVIAEHEKSAKFANTRDDNKASFCMTVVEALKELLEYLDQGTVESMKQAQLHMSSLMSPIATLIPDSVKKFVLMGGRKPSLRDLFDSKRETKKGL